MRKEQLTLFDIQTKIENSTSTVDELRVPIFAPVSKIVKNSRTYKDFIENKNVRVVKTKWGTVEIRNRLLTDTHKSIIDVILSVHRKTKRLPDGSIAIYFSLYEAWKMYQNSNNAKSRNFKWFKEKIDEIRDTVIKYKDNHGNEFDFNIISHQAYSEKEDLYGIVFDARYVKFYENGLSVNYKREVANLLELESPLLRSIIRFFFTHKQLNLNIMDLLETIGFPMESDRSIRYAKKEVKENIDTLEKFGILYNPKNETFYYQGLNSVKILPACINAIE
ncbi:hypothetical protein [Nitrosophilus labii]|uniref:hypothetical protein n=1 Tax=Nitrosophilus labii TaxID=2706014 RepID=UPI001656D0EA|nr:hypothetical protein [Nitrosophilus labii]